MIQRVAGCPLRRRLTQERRMPEKLIRSGQSASTRHCASLSLAAAEPSLPSQPDELGCSKPSPDLASRAWGPLVFDIAFITIEQRLS
jgi:hypothetical protein